MSNVRKTWKTLSAVPDPFEAGVVYVTQELTGHEVTYTHLLSISSQGRKRTKETEERTLWVPLFSESEFDFGADGKKVRESLTAVPTSRVQRCRLHANGRLENTDVDPRAMDSSYKVGLVDMDDWRRAHGFEPVDAISSLSPAASTKGYPELPNGLTLSTDGTLLNWLGENYVRQSDLPEGSWPELDVNGNQVVPEGGWLADEDPMPIEQVLGVLRMWMKDEDVRVAVLCHPYRASSVSMLKQALGAAGTRVGGTKLSYSALQQSLVVEGKHELKLQFFNMDKPSELRGHQFSHFIVASAVVDAENPPVDDTGLTALGNLKFALRLGDNPSGIVLQS